MYCLSLLSYCVSCNALALLIRMILIKRGLLLWRCSLCINVPSFPDDELLVDPLAVLLVLVIVLVFVICIDKHYFVAMLVADYTLVW